MAPGKRTDLASWGVAGPEAAGTWDPVAALEPSGPHRACAVRVDGQPVVRTGRLSTVNADEIVTRAKRRAVALYGRRRTRANDV